MISKSGRETARIRRQRVESLRESYQRTEESDVFSCSLFEAAGLTLQLLPFRATWEMKGRHENILSQMRWSLEKRQMSRRHPCAYTHKSNRVHMVLFVPRLLRTWCVTCGLTVFACIKECISISSCVGPPSCHCCCHHYWCACLCFFLSLCSLHVCKSK